MRTHYRFDHSWHVDAAPDAVRALLGDVRGYGAWWPAVRVTGGSLEGTAHAADLEVRAPLGYRLRIALAERERGPLELRAAIGGDLEGWCSWRIQPEGAGTRVGFAQEVEARAPLLRAASPLLHGAFARQHGAVMRSAERGMRAALTG
ncbi:MAG: SRPBCC family protein [Actinomycetota bacterium]